MKREQVRLRMERALIEKAKRFAREHSISASSMVADFFDGLKRYAPQAKGMVLLRGTYVARSSPKEVSLDQQIRGLLAVP
jgi:hypothetical protein